MNKRIFYCQTFTYDVRSDGGQHTYDRLKTIQKIQSFLSTRRNGLKAGAIEEKRQKANIKNKIVFQFKRDSYCKRRIEGAKR